MRAVRLARDESGDDADPCRTCHRGGAGHTIRRLAEEIEHDAVVPARILIGKKSDDPAFLHHAEHLAHVVLVDDVHTNEPPILVDEAIHRRILLAHGDADEWKSRL